MKILKFVLPDYTLNLMDDDKVQLKYSIPSTSRVKLTTNQEMKMDNEKFLNSATSLNRTDDGNAKNDTTMQISNKETKEIRKDKRG